MADSSALQALATALQTCSLDPPTSPDAARAALSAADLATQALAHLLAEPAQHAVALDSAVRCTAGSSWERVMWLGWLPNQWLGWLPKQWLGWLPNQTVCSAGMLQPRRPKPLHAGRLPAATCWRLVNCCALMPLARSAMVPWVQSFVGRLDRWEAALGLQPVGPEKSALVRPVRLPSCRVCEYLQVLPAVLIA